ncbi:MAG TPA: serine/threonine-protein kinase [Kofleriaceae bacterium]
MADRAPAADEQQYIPSETAVTVVDGEPPMPPPQPVLGGIERFMVLAKLGEGGMGTVYAAYDSLLDRKVAVKVVRADRRHALATVSPRDQLLREAQAMGRLAHPNVVAVHEVGEVADSIYIVIELVDGTTLDRWLKERQRSWQDIVAAFCQAGRGLAAAHEAGLVHRDVKPQNIMVRRDGRIQITDFGVVRMSGSHNDTTPSDASANLLSELTYAGHRVGTPSYMAPEQYAGGELDARADQFSFAVALYEALYGTRPFSGSDAERLAAIRAGKLAAPRAGTAVPKFIEPVLRRALAADMAARWPSLDDMLAALARDPTRVGHRRLAIAAAVLGVAALGIVGLLGWTRSASAPSPCSGTEAQLTSHWDRNRAAAIRAAFAREGNELDKAAATRIINNLDAWSHRWVAMRVDACRATRITGEQSDALLDARMHCLDRQLDEVDQLATALTGKDRVALAREPQLPLPDIAICADRESVLARVPPPTTSAIRQRVLSLEHELATINSIAHTGRYHDARAAATVTTAAALALGFAPLTAQATLVRGQLEEQDGDLAAARTTLAEAARLAASAHDDRTQARALLDLVGVLLDSGEIAEALTLSIAAAAAVERTNDHGLEAELAEQLGAIHLAKGDADAEPHLERALALREAADADSLATAQVLNKLANVWLHAGRSADARTAYERALRIATVQLGTEHPATAIARANLCYLDADAGKLDEARSCQEAVLAILEHALGDHHPQVAWALNEVALVQREQGDSVGAAKRFERALAIWEQASGPDHPDVAWPLINLGELANARKDYAQAERLCRRAKQILDHAKGDPSDAVPAFTCLAEAQLPRNAREALASATRAHELAANTPDAAETALLLARCQARTGNPRAAVVTAKAALSTAEGKPRAALQAWLGNHAAR